MDKETYESQKAFAGEKVVSMHRRMVDHDYQERQIYMITMATEGRRPLLGQVVGKSDGLSGTPDEPRTVPTELGRSVEQCWQEIALRYPQIDVLAFQLMPDHFHGILFVKERLDRPLGKVLLGFKQGCNKAFRALLPSVASVAVLQQQTKPDRKHGLLFETNYNDKVLMQAGQLKRWNEYLRDNPRRLTEAEIQAKVGECLSAAAKGAVLVSPSISPGEKAVMHAAFEHGYPLIYLQENGFTDLAKPGGQRMEACARGQLLILAPWEHHNERTSIRRDQCLSLNEMARIICSDCCCTTATDITTG